MPIPFTDDQLDIRYDCLAEYFDCYGGAHQPLEQGRSHKPSAPRAQKRLEAALQAQEQFFKKVSATSTEPDEPGAAENTENENLNDLITFTGESPSRASKVAIAGTLGNKRATLINGEQVEVIHPDLRGMSTWNTLGLLNAAMNAVGGLGTTREKDAWSFVARIGSRLYELTRNNGQAAQDRAINWAATAFIHDVASLITSRTFRELLGEDTAAGKTALTQAAVYDFQIRPSSCRESGGEFDVELSLFSVENAYRGMTVIASKVDVSDVVPVTLSVPRVFNKPSPRF